MTSAILFGLGLVWGIAYYALGRRSLRLIALAATCMVAAFLVR